MEKHFKILTATRNNIIRATEGFTDAQLNLIPEGFNNNLIWNMGHIVITQQLLCYSLSGLTPIVDNDMLGRYRKGSKPEGDVSAEEIALIKDLLATSGGQMEADFAAGKFQNYKEYTTSYNVTLASAEDAIMFNNVHEGLHFGNILSMKKLV